MYEKQVFNKKKLKASDIEREKLFGKMYLSEIIDLEKPEFGSNNLIMAPVGSGKSYLIENRLIPKGFKGNALYLTSNTSLKDSLCPDNNEVRERMANNGSSVKYFTSSNRKRYGDKPYNVHVMTYHEFGERIANPQKEFVDNIDLIFCDEIHSLPIYMDYGGNAKLLVALIWLFEKHNDKEIYYFTATSDSLESLDRKSPGFLLNAKVFNYLDHVNIRRYEVRSTYYISHLAQLRTHLRAKIDYVNRNGAKGLAFTKRISEQDRIFKIAKEEGYSPIALWSINNEEKKMSDSQVMVRDFLLETGRIPEPYNLLIINNAMQEGWSLFDNKVEFAVLNTTDKTEQVQALGRIRKDVDFIVIKTDDSKKISETINIDKLYLNKQLTSDDKEELRRDLNILDVRGRQVGWTVIKKMVEEKGYIITDSSPTIDGKRTRVSTITESV